jgi:hypothetical protein
LRVTLAKNRQRTRTSAGREPTVAMIDSLTPQEFLFLKFTKPAKPLFAPNQ